MYMINEYEIYPSMEEYLELVHDANPSIASHQAGVRASWVLGETYETAMKKARHGDLSAVGEAEKILDEINTHINVEGLRPQWLPSVAGAIPNVPAYLANSSPLTMFNFQDSQTDKSALNLLFSPVCNAAIEPEDVYRRGVTVLAAVLALQRIRPVNLMIASCSEVKDHAVILKSNPMVLSEVAFALTNPAMFRHLFFGYHTANGWHGVRASWWSHDDKVTIAEFKRRLELGEDDIVIPSIKNTQDEILKYPIKWVNGLLDKYRQ